MLPAARTEMHLCRGNCRRGGCRERNLHKCLQETRSVNRHCTPPGPKSTEPPASTLSPPSVPLAQPLHLISELQPPSPCCQPEPGGERRLTLKASPELVSNSEETSCFSVEILSATSSDQRIVCYSTMSQKILLGSELPSRPVTLTLGCTLESLGISKMKNAKAGATESELPEIGPRNVS